MTDKVRIELWGMGDPFLGVIVPAPTGIVWTNQTGGMCCAHPELEGFLVPLAGEGPREPDPFENVFPGMNPYDPVQVQQWLEFNGLEPLFEPLRATDEAPDHAEAWIWVRIRCAPEHLFRSVALQNLCGRVAVLTYNNSD